MNGGARIAAVLERWGIEHLFTLCGGHISPILVEAKRRGIRVVDVRHEASAVFAADAAARLRGIPGVAAVTAGPGVTNTVTAVENARLAQSPVVVLGGATGTILKGRGSLQDIDQMSLMRPHVKWAASVDRVRDLAPAVEHALRTARSGVPGPVFLECPVDLLYDEQTVRTLYVEMGAGKSPRGVLPKAMAWYLNRYVDRLFRGAGDSDTPSVGACAEPAIGGWTLRRVRRRLDRARRPVLMAGSQATLDAAAIADTAAAVRRLGIPVFLSGMGRGLLGRGDELQLRHQRRKALREADLVILAGVPCDFRLDYGRQIARSADVIAVNRSAEDLRKNRSPEIAIEADPGAFLRHLAETAGDGWRRDEWLQRLRVRDHEREEQIGEFAARKTEYVNPLALCREIERVVDDDSVLIADGGDFVATVSYTVSPRGPLSWLDPGVFGTLGVGGGFALGAATSRRGSEVWIFYGDGSAAYSLAEFDSFVRHETPVIAVVGNDASWAQIARDQVVMLEDDVGTVLRRTDYHRVAEGYGGVGLLLDKPEDMAEVLATAKAHAAAGRPVLVNALLGATDFRKGSLSM
jgi:acetolactate synthase-1/2/3 large subunit